MIRIIFNIVGFNAGWLGCVLASRHDMPLVALPIVAAILLINLALAPAAERRGLAASIGIISLMGVPLDCLMLMTGVLRFQGSSALSLTFVLWIGAFWLNFAATMGVSLRWLQGRWLLAAALGAISAPGTYALGARLGALDLHESVGVWLPALAVEWAVALPAAAWIARRFTASGEGTDRGAMLPGGSATEGRPAS